MEIEVKSTHEFNDFAARRILSIIEHSVDHQGHCTVALSGGNTPREVYEAIVRLQNDFDINWKRVFFFWGDERLVPSDDLSSNTRMAYENLLDHLPVPGFNIFPFRTDLSVEEAAADMEEKIRNHFDVLTINAFDLVLLGLGEEGHTLSLFPQSYALKITDQWVYGYFVGEKIGYRLTFLPVPINNSLNTIFLVRGAKKADIIKQVLFGRKDIDLYPAQVIRPTNGKLEWIVDEEAAVNIKK